MTNRFPFTVKRLAELKAPADKDRLWYFDEKQPKLAYMVTRAGKRSFYFYYKAANGQTVRYLLGGGALSLDSMRGRVIDLMGLVAKGVDIQHNRQEAKAEKTFGDVFEWYMEHHSKLEKRTTAEDRQRYEQYVEKPFAKRKLSSITSRDILALKRKIGSVDKKPRVANRVLSLISSVYKNSKEEFGLETNPVAGIKRFEEKKRRRFLLASELPRFFAALDEVSPDLQDFFLLCLYTGARSSNVMAMEWVELSLSDALWHIPASKFKTKEDKQIPLANEAIEIINRRKTSRPDLEKDDPRRRYVFPSRIGSACPHLSEPKKSWAKILKAAKLGGDRLRIHDLRRSLGSWQAAGGASLTIIGKSLGHTSQASTAIYAQLELAPVRASVQNAVSAILAAKEVKTDANPSAEGRKRKK